MIMEKHYYLVNGTVKVSDSKMPEIKKYRQTMGSVVYEARYKRDYNKWLSSLQPCEIDESELDKIVLESHWNYNSKPKDITNIVFEKDCKIYFKQPTEKQVESEFVETYDKEWIIDFVVWYSGVNKNSVNKAFQRYIDEVVLNNK